MRRFGGWWIPLLVACLGLGAGCVPSTDSRLDELKDPNYLAGMSRKQEGSYSAAVAAFEKALEVNPQSSAAHMQLGFLYYENLRRWPEAIYHFQKHLELNPQSNQADTLRTFIGSSKQMIAREYPLAGLSVQMQQELAKLEGLNRENALLKQQVTVLKAQLDELRTNALAVAARPPEGAPPHPAEAMPPVGRTAPSPLPAPSSNLVTQARAGGASGATPTPVPGASSVRTHRVRPGETPYAIARQHGVSLSALLAANPGLNSRNLKVDQTINLPSR